MKSKDARVPLPTFQHGIQELQELLHGHEAGIQESLAYIIESTGYMDGLLQDLSTIKATQLEPLSSSARIHRFPLSPLRK